MSTFALPEHGRPTSYGIAEPWSTWPNLVTLVRTVVAVGLGVAAVAGADLQVLALAYAAYWVGDVADGWLARWLGQEDLEPVETPVVESLDAGPGTSLHRSLGYGVDANNGVVVSVRYAVDDGRPDALVLAHAVSDVPREVLAATDDIEAMLRTVTVTDSPVDA